MRRLGGASARDELCIPFRLLLQSAQPASSWQESGRVRPVRPQRTAPAPGRPQVCQATPGLPNKAAKRTQTAIAPRTRQVLPVDELAEAFYLKMIVYQP